MKSKNAHHGSSFEEFLKSEGLLESARAHAAKRVLAWQIQEAMKKKKYTKTTMARRMKTSRAHLDRLLDPTNDRIQLDTAERAAAAVGRTLRAELA